MPVPNPVTQDIGLKCIYWEYNNNRYIYKSDIDVFDNPYKLINDYTYDLLKKSSIKEKFGFVPMVHPILDSIEYINEIIEKYNPLAIKIHGISTATGPYDISEELIKLLHKKDIPLIVHTDYCKKPTNAIEFLRKKNNPYDWAMFFINNEIKGYLTHGARMDKKVFDLVNSHDNLVIGIGPDFKINLERTRWVEASDDDYLNIIRDSVDTNKILFDIDYSWNIDSSKKLETNQICRIKKIFTPKEKKKILAKNAINFFNIKEK